MAPTPGSAKVPGPLIDLGNCHRRCASPIPYPKSECACGDDILMYPGGYSSTHIVPGVHANSSMRAGNGLLGLLPARQPRARTSLQTPRRPASSPHPKQPGDLRLATLLEFAISHRLHERAGPASVDSRATTSELDIQDALLAARIRAAHARLSHSRPAPLDASAPSLLLSGSAVLDVAVTRGVSHPKSTPYPPCYPPCVNAETPPPSMYELVAALLLRRHERGVGSQIARFAHGVRAWSPKASPLGQCGSATEFAIVTV